MTRARHASAAKPKPFRAKLIPVLAAALTAVAGSAALAWPDGGDSTANTAVTQPEQTLTSAPQREERVSRNQTTARPPATVTPKATTPPVKKRVTPPKTPSPTPKQVESPAPKAAGSRYVTEALNVRTGPAETFDVLTVLEVGSKVSITGETDGEWAQIISDEKVRWVKAAYLSKEKPSEDEDTGGGISSAPCPDGSSVEDGLRPDTIRVHRAVCARFPGVSSYGGMRGGGGEHGVGRALDIMCNSSLGDDIAAWVRSHAKALGVSEVIWEQRIWTVDRGSEGWRPMEDRGSATANHYDHVHVTTYGDAGTS